MKIALSLMMSLLFFSCSQDAIKGCDSDTQCRQGRVCLNRVCTDNDDGDGDGESPQPQPLPEDECQKNDDCAEGFACAKNQSGEFVCTPADLASGTGELRDNDCNFSWEFTVIEGERAKMECSRLEGDTFRCSCSYITAERNKTAEAESESCEFLAAEDFMNHYCDTKFRGSF